MSEAMEPFGEWQGGHLPLSDFKNSPLGRHPVAAV